MSNAKELRDLSVEELDSRYLDTRKELFNLVNERQNAGRQFDKPHRIRTTRREIARILTIAQQKRAANQKG